MVPPNDRLGIRRMIGVAMINLCFPDGVSDVFFIIRVGGKRRGAKRSEAPRSELRGASRRAPPTKAAKLERCISQREETSVRVWYRRRGF